MRGYRVGGLAVPVLGLALAACGDRAAGGLSDAVLAAPAPDPVSQRAFSGGREDRVTRGRPNRTQRGMREQPEVFAATTVALWDGQPTLEGLWIGHALTDVAHRVRVRNPRTGTVVDGALLPLRSGSERQMVVSAEAADALGLTPSVPAELELVAIEPRREAAGAAGQAAPVSVSVAVPAPDAPDAGTPAADASAYMKSGPVVAPAEAAEPAPDPKTAPRGDETKRHES